MDEFQRNTYAAACDRNRGFLVGLNNREELTAESEPDIFDKSTRLERALVIQAWTGTHCD